MVHSILGELVLMCNSVFEISSLYVAILMKVVVPAFLYAQGFYPDRLREQCERTKAPQRGCLRIAAASCNHQGSIVRCHLKVEIYRVARNAPGPTYYVLRYFGLFQTSIISDIYMVLP